MGRIGIMGGTFNPIHLGHLLLAEAAFEEYKLDTVWFMPSKRPPHKAADSVIADYYRKDMTKLAIEDNRHFELSTLELDREGRTYTVDTFRALTTACPQDAFYFIMGGDSLFQFETWKEPESILHLAHVVAASRYHMEEKKILEQIALLNQTYKSEIKLLSMPAVDISAKMIRRYRKEGRSIRYFTPDKVISYITQYHLYE